MSEPLKPFQWPLARFGNREPTVLAEHPADPHQGIDLGYAAAPFDRELFVPVHAANDGELVYAIDREDGFAVCLDHGGAWATHYAHLSRMFVPPRSPHLHAPGCAVKSGEVIGYAAKQPLHIRFELWRRTRHQGYLPVDPRPHLAQWRSTPSPAELRNAPPMEAA